MSKESSNMNCLNCNKDTVNPKFCSKSCAASFNNKGIRRHGKSKPKCLNCSNYTSKRRQKFCSRNCLSAYHWKISITKITNGEVIPAIKKLRKYLLTVHPFCAECNNGIEWNGKPIALEMDHIDGDSTNNSLINVRLLCPNCHSQTPTYRVKNKNNQKGSDNRKRRYLRQVKNLAPSTGLEPA